MTGRLVLAVVNYKGGTTKTTSAVFLAHALHELGRTVLLVDADPQGSAMSWNDSAPEQFPFTTLPMATPTLNRQLLDVAGNKYDAIVIDTPPIEQKSGIVVSALKVATMAVCPMAPTPIEYDRLPGIRQVTIDIADLRSDGRPVPLAVLLTRTVPNALSTAAYRQQITSDGILCLNAAVGTLQRFAQAYADNITDALDSAYGDAVSEILKEQTT